MSQNFQVNESDIFNNLIKKITETKENLEKIQTHTSECDNEKNIMYLEKLNELSSTIHMLHSISTDLYDEYLLGVPLDRLSNEERQKVNLVINNKKIYNTFAPYMLYMGIMLQNSHS